MVFQLAEAMVELSVDLMAHGRDDSMADRMGTKLVEQKVAEMAVSKVGHWGAQKVVEKVDPWAVAKAMRKVHQLVYMKADQLVDK